uniref:Transmembrane 9 superfamily member n=1 Tax=Elaeophora elaphi TaxID=1147741 RepID=A0A0R3RMQ2_9BILA
MLKMKRWPQIDELYASSEERMDTVNEYNLHICYQFHRSYFKKTFNKLYCCKWTTMKGCLSGDEHDQVAASSSLTGSTENVEAIGRRGELIEFVIPVPIRYNYDDDITVRFEL